MKHNHFCLVEFVNVLHFLSDVLCLKVDESLKGFVYFSLFVSQGRTGLVV